LVLDVFTYTEELPKTRQVSKGSVVCERRKSQFISQYHFYFY